MDFEFNEEQQMLKASVERLMTQRYGFEQRKSYSTRADGWSREMWAQYAELGLLGLSFAENDGGFGGGATESLIVMEALGRALALEPYLATVVLCGGCLTLGASEAQRVSVIPEIASGRALLAFAHSETQARYRLSDVCTTARMEGDHWVLNGTKTTVIHGDCANQLLVSARVRGERQAQDGIAIFLVNATSPGVTRKGFPTYDGLRAAEVTFASVRVDGANVIGKPGEAYPLIERTVDRAIAALCAEAVGAMTAAHEITVEYLKTRKQFGVLIGSFQALQHRAVEMLVALEQARSMAIFAMAMAEDPDSDVRRKAIAAAKVQIGKSGRFIGQQAIQLHGAIGITLEYVIGHYFRRLCAIEQLFGDTDHHLAMLAREGGFVAAEVDDELS